MEMSSATPPRALTIAGSDSGGGAGIQADLKTFAALGVFGTSAITAITAQNTLGVSAVAEVPVQVISDQIEAVVSDIGVCAVKTGMLSSAEIVECVAENVQRLELSPLVVDPVMIAATGAQLLQEDAIESVRSRMVPLATVVTPNVPEAEVLTGVEIESVDDMELAGGELVAMGADAAIVKGGHFDDGSGRITDVLVTKEAVRHFTSIRIDTIKQSRYRLHVCFGDSGAPCSRDRARDRGRFVAAVCLERHGKRGADRRRTRATEPYVRAPPST